MPPRIKSVLSVKIEPETLKKYKAWCNKNGVKINRKTEMLIKQFLVEEKRGDLNV